MERMIDQLIAAAALFIAYQGQEMRKTTQQHKKMLKYLHT